MLRRVGKHTLIVAVALVLGLVCGFIAAMLTSPFWDWFEAKTGIESMGHGGPDEWVFRFMIALATISIFVLLEWIFRHKPAAASATES